MLLLVRFTSYQYTAQRSVEYVKLVIHFLANPKIVFTVEPVFNGTVMYV
jgi:hypothetical protein